MRFTLKDFQVVAADQLMAALLDARPAAARGVSAGSVDLPQ